MKDGTGQQINIKEWFPKGLDGLAQPTREEILEAVADTDWQAFRVRLKGVCTVDKVAACGTWLAVHNYSWKARVQVVNYINALKRGGQIAISGDIQR